MGRRNDGVAKSQSSGMMPTNAKFSTVTGLAPNRSMARPQKSCITMPVTPPIIE